ncbi:MAG: copper-translocating P-type ATPase [Candidatus Sumerlaeia bacterium]|nr:copper-translocating P-type ATPase [Candidatus Sumerlaeia bacterium]
MTEAKTKTLYTCGMHPQLELPAPGNCPLCGCPLQPIEGTGADGTDAHHREMMWRFWGALVFTLPVFVSAMWLHVPGNPFSPLLPPQVQTWMELILSGVVVFGFGFPILRLGVQSIFTNYYNMFTLILLGTTAAYTYSTIAALFPRLIPAEFLDHHGMVPVYFEASAVITTLVLLGQVLELRARLKTAEALKELLGRFPNVAHVVQLDGSEKDVPREELAVGMKIRIRPGESIPVDGIVLEGRSTIDASSVTGEPIPQSATHGDFIVGGTLNGNGALLVEARKVGKDSLLEQVVRLVQEAQREKAPIARLADRVAGYFVPIVIGVSFASFTLWLFLGPAPAMTFAILNGVGVLIIACPCALGLATPMSILVGTGCGAKHGILVRRAEALERLARVDTIVLDKTGTLTKGRPTISDVLMFSDDQESDIMHRLASLESRSEHVLAGGFREWLEARSLPHLKVRRVEALPGRGIVGLVEKQEIAAGNRELMVQLCQDISPLVSEEKKNWIQGHRDRGDTVIFMAVEGTLKAAVALADEIKPGTREAVSMLKKKGYHLHILSGDSTGAVKLMGEELSISDARGGLLPEEKHAALKSLQQQGRVVAMVGDGINDAPALALADVGIALGTGTDLALQSAGITLLNGDLRGILQAIHLSRATLTNIRQNLFFAFVYNGFGIPIAAGALHPIFGLLLNPMFAAFAMMCSSLCVIGNALRLRGLKL